MGLTREQILKRAEDFCEFLARSAKKAKRYEDGVRCCCPRPGHDDKNPSFSFSISKDAFACSCGSGKGSDLRMELGYTHPFDHPILAQPAPILIRSPESTRIESDPVGDPDCIHEFANGNRKLKWRNPKRVVWEHIIEGKVYPGMQGDPGLYNQELIPTSELIYLSESESDCDALTSLGFVAVSVPHGAHKNAKKQQISDEHIKLLVGKEVAIFMHNDEAGEGFALSCLSSLRKKTRKTWIIKIEDPFKDIRDGIEIGGFDRRKIQEITLASKPIPPEGDEAPKLCEKTEDSVDYIIKPFVPRGALCQLQGEPKGGKSCFGLYMALCAAKGIWPAGRLSITRPHKVVFMTWEDGPIRIKTRLLQYNPPINHGPLPDNLVVYTHSTSPQLWVNNPEGEEMLLDIINHYQADLVFLDTLSYLHNADENKSQEMKQVMQALRNCAVKTNCGIVIIHHTRKSSSGGDVGSAQARGRGSSAIIAAADCIIDWGSRSQQNVTNCAFISKDSDGFDFSVIYKPLEDETVDWEIDEAKEANSTKEGRKTVLEAIQKLYGTIECEEGVTRKALDGALKISKNSIIKYCKLLVEEGSIEERKSGSLRAAVYVPVEKEDRRSAE